MKRFLYRAYGLTIDSDLQIPELVPVETSGACHGTDHVRITTGDLPRHLNEPISRSSIHETTRDELLLRIAGVGEYLIARGNSITVRPDERSTPHEVRVFLLGTGMGALLHQRGFLVLHASGIGTDRGGVIFAGPSGAGKSTLLGELLRRGHRMMVDDVCAVQLDEHGTPIIIPSYPRTRVWADAAAQLDVDTKGLERTRPDMEKFERQVPEQFWGEPAGLRRIYRLTPRRDDVFELVELGPVEAFSAVLENTYRSILLDGFDLRSHHFSLASAVARDVRVVRVERPSQGFRVTELADIILDDLDGPW